MSPRTHGVVHGDPGEEPVQLRVKITEISFHGMPCQHIAETRHHDFGDKCWGISSISQIDDRCEYTTLLPFKGHVPHGRTAGPDSGRPSALIDLTSPQGESRDEMGWCDGLLMNLVPLLRLH